MLMRAATVVQVLLVLSFIACFILLVIAPLAVGNDGVLVKAAVSPRRAGNI